MSRDQCDGEAHTVSANAADTLPASSLGPAAQQRNEPDDYPALLPVQGEHYVLRAEIAAGGMGRIRTARDRRLGRDVAVKETLARAGDAVRRFEREARITARLQHPSIVSVHEAGVWPTGEPFYTMELVRGRSLDEVIDAAGTLDGRLALLPNVLAVADAMAYAHGQRIVHRDLKPRNVLVGAFGETVVIDWGLAKDLGDAADSLDPARPHLQSGAGDGQTAVGEILGTPAYMPPEQAAGRSVDERADVYAIGAILDHLLSGKPPYAGTSAIEVIDAVKRGPPTPLSQRQAGVPPDLLAIVGRAMARDPAARYPTARELAEDLRRYQTGQLVGAHRYSLRQLVWRWLRRYRAPVAVASVAMLVLAIVGVIALQRIVRAQRVAEEQRVQAERERRLAQQRGEDAEDLLGFMLVDLRDKLDPLGKLDLLDVVAKKAVAYYDRRQGDTTDADLRKRALALRNLADVLSRQGHADEALRELRAALALVETVVAQAPADATARRDLALVHDAIALVLFAQGDTAGALAEYRASVAIAGELAAADPASVDRQRDLWVNRARIGDVLRAQGDTNAASAEYRAALAIAQELATRAPSDRAQRDLAISHLRVGDVMRIRQDAAAALVEYRACLAIFEVLAAKDPADANHRRSLGVAHVKVGDVLFDAGDLDGALAEYRAYVAAVAVLAAGDPTSAERQRDLSVSHQRVADVLLERRDVGAALDEYRTALAIDQSLAANDPTNADRQRDLAVSHMNIGDAHRAGGDTAGALAAYRSCLAILQPLATRDPTNANRQRDVASSERKVADMLLARGDRAGALATYRSALTVAQRLEAMDPTNGEWRELAAALAEQVERCCAATR